MTEQEEHERRVRQGRISKNKGNAAEQKYARIFREAGWKDSLTMRYVSKLKDDRKLDLHAVPVNLQIKAGSQKGLNVRKALSDIKEAVAKLPLHFPEHQHHAAVLHCKGATFTPAGTGKKGGWTSTEFDDIVSMTFKDYFNLLCMLHEKGKFSAAITFVDGEGAIIDVAEIPKQDDANH